MRKTMCFVRVDVFGREIYLLGFRSRSTDKLKGKSFLDCFNANPESPFTYSHRDVLNG